MYALPRNELVGTRHTGPVPQRLDAVAQTLEQQATIAVKFGPMRCQKDSRPALAENLLCSLERTQLPALNIHLEYVGQWQHAAGAERIQRHGLDRQATGVTDPAHRGVGSRI